MNLFDFKGVCLQSNQRLFVDAAGLRNENIIVSHAHSDHARLNNSNNYFMSQGTAALLSKKVDGMNTIDFEKQIDLGDISFSLHKSSHLMGSSQLKVSGHKEVVVTSDFKLHESILFKPAEVLQSDILLIESTFGLPEFVFPKREQVYNEMRQWVQEQLNDNRFVVLGGYSTGKAQELTKFLNEYCSIAPLVYRKVFEQNNAYEEQGLKLGDYLLLDHNLKESNVLIMPPHLLNDELLHAVSISSGKKVSAAVATGWKSFSRGFKCFPLSDHADFNQLMQYVVESEPKLVLTHHGFSAEFARAIQRRLRVAATELASRGQKTIAEFA